MAALAALAALAFACAHSAGAQTPPQACKYATRMAHGQDMGIANEYTEAAWSDPWYRANASLTGVPTYITYYDQKEVARVVGRESVPVLESRLLPVK